MPDFLDRLGEELRAVTVAEALAPLPATTGNISVTRRPRPSRNRRWLVAVALFVVAGAGGAAIAIESGPNPGPVPPRPGAPLAGSIEPSQLAAFGLLRRAQTPQDVIPPYVTPFTSGASGANRGLSRRVLGPDGTTAWILPGRGSLCLDAHWGLPHYPGGGACVRNADAIGGLLYTVAATHEAPGPLLAGLVPDGVDTVTVHLEPGPDLHVPVHENVYFAILHGTWKSLTFTGPHGPVEVQGFEIPEVVSPSKRE